MNKTTLNLQHYQSKIKAGSNVIKLTNQSDNDKASINIDGQHFTIGTFPGNKVSVPVVPGQIYTVTYYRVSGYYR